MGRMFASTRPKGSKGAQDRRATVCEAIKKMLSDWTLNRLNMSTVCKKNCSLYDAMVYKFGKSNRRQKYWLHVRQIYTGLQRINKRPMVKSFEKFAMVGF
jgi:hypothetical protein